MVQTTLSFIFRFSVVTVTLVVALLLSALNGSKAKLAAGAKPRGKAGIEKTLQTRSLVFEPNQGQTASDVSYLAHAQAYDLFLTPNRLLVVDSALHGGDAAQDPRKRFSTSQRRGSDAKRMVLGLHFENSNPKAKSEALQPSRGRVNYFTGNDPTRWHTGIPTYRQVTERQVWPGIDVSWHGNDGLVEGDFVVAPGAGPRRIRLGIEGRAKVAIDKEGSLLLQRDGTSFKFLKPTIYQFIDGKRRLVDGRYILTERRPSKETVGFEVSRYDISRSLVIDPVVALAYSTYLGGTSTDDPIALPLTTMAKPTSQGGRPRSTSPHSTRFRLPIRPVAPRRAS